MDNKINFTGIRNIGGIKITQIDMRNLKPFESKFLIAHLSDDKGEDLTKFYNALKKSMLPLNKYSFPLDDNYISIYTEKPIKTRKSQTDRFGYQLDKQDLEFILRETQRQAPAKIFLNNHEIPVNRHTMPIFTELARITRKIAGICKNPKREYKIDESFKYGAQGDLYVFGGNGFKVSNLCRSEEEYLQYIETIYNPQNAKSLANMINQDIQIKMEDYLA